MVGLFIHGVKKFRTSELWGLSMIVTSRDAESVIDEERDIIAITTRNGKKASY